MSIPEEFTTAPAAFGVYSDPSFYSNGGYYDYPHAYSYQDYYDIEPPFDMKSGAEGDFRDHVNPAMLDASYGYMIESSQTVVLEKEGKKNKPRQQGQPTNIVPTAKMDRKTLKRLRNRVSASRCRIKKKEWISEMEDESMQLHEENNFLLKKIGLLEEAILKAKQMLEYYQAPTI
jgi:hypothetical protein